MWIVKLALARPYTFIVFSLVLLLIAPVVLLRTPVDIFPSINIPVVSVIWTYSGLPPAEMEPRVVSIFERSLTTLVNNIETLHWVPTILEKGAAWFAAQGKNGGKGLRSYSVSGRVKKPGVVLAAAGSTCRELIAHCGGMLDGHHFKGYLPGGASGASCRPICPTFP